MKIKRKKKNLLRIFPAIIVSLFLIFSLFGNNVMASVDQNDTPDNDPYYDMISVPETSAVLMGEDGSSADGNAIVNHSNDGNVLTVDYGISKALNGTVPIPNNVYNSTITITNDTSDAWELDTYNSMQIYMWTYLNDSATYTDFQEVLDKWIMFKFLMVGPDGTTTTISPYATITDYSGSANYHFPSESESHVLIDDYSSLNGGYYAKATVPTQSIILNPGESMEIPWNLGLSWMADNSTQNMQMDFNIRLNFTRVEADTYGYRVNYYKDNVDESNLLGVEYGKSTFKEYHELIEIDVETDLGQNWMNLYQPANYEEGTVETYPVISINEEENMVNVVYAPIPAATTYGYQVNYYKDSIDEDNLLATTNGITEFEADHQLTEEEIETDLGQDWINAYQPADYESGVAGSYPVISVEEDTNVVNVVYAPIPPEETYTYQVNYYRDSIDEDNLIASEEGITEFEAGHQLTEEEIEADLGEDWIDEYQPDGYADGMIGSYPVISIDEESNIENVVYISIPLEDTYSYRVNYYKESIDENNLLATTNGITEFEAGHQLTEEEIEADLKDTWIVEYQPDGYTDGMVESYPVITNDEANNVINVVYKKAEAVDTSSGTTTPPTTSDDTNDSGETAEEQTPPVTGQKDIFLESVVLLLGSLALVLWVVKKETIKK
ncbi:hypothetical protein [Breznakia pachnodae]|uniref:Transcriptional regulator n=1 Tax=Breznakia pachnodae TaxID=265178 RepID=A0ABU0E2I5_9FIRM|nr:hypothetical protein [Breznakia pachnodae]MDQ0361107.1 putative transcriptional regulator [Breznakia pachnodae]